MNKQAQQIYEWVNQNCRFIEKGYDEFEIFLDSLVIEDVELEEWSESFSAGVKHGRVLEQNLQETDKEITKRVIGLYQDRLPLLTTPETVAKFQLADEIKGCLDEDKE